MTTTNKPTLSREVDLKIDFSKRVSVRQYCDPEIPNMGMEKYNMSIFSGENGVGGHKEWLGYKQVGNKKIYLTGLDVNADSVKAIKDENLREQKIKEIEQTVDFLEESFGEYTLAPTNAEFWQNQFIEIRKPVLELDLTNPKDLFTYYAIFGGGFSEIATSFESAKNSNKIYKYYLHQEDEVADVKIEVTKLRNKARTELENLDNEDSEKMFKISKLLLPIEKGFNRKTPKSRIYGDLNDYIDGLYSANDTKGAPKRFIEISKTDRTTLNMQAIVREALYQNFIVKNTDQIFWNPQTQVSYGRNENEIIAFLSNPIHTDELSQINSRVDKIWK